MKGTVIACFVAGLLFCKTSLAQSVPQFDHIVVVIGENTNQSSIYGNNTNAPYINTLIGAGAKFTDAHGNIHPSQENYLHLFSGDNQGVVGDEDYSNAAKFTTANLAASLVAAGKTFRIYSEGLPSVGYNGSSSGKYVRKHNPLANWMGSGTNQVPTTLNQPFTAFPTNFNNLPSVAFVVPDMCSDGHDVCNSSGKTRYRQFDDWIKANLDSYKQWCINNNSLLIVTYDEDNFTNKNLIATVFYGANVKQGSYSNYINHHNVLRFMEDANGLTSHAGAAANVTTIDYCWGTNTPGYCTSSGLDATHENISKVTLNNVSKTSANTTGYSDFTTTVFSLTKGSAYNISITPAWPGTKYDEAYAVFIDYNNDSKFDGPGETVWTKSLSQQTPVSGSFTVPATAVTGNVRMRISMSDAGVPASCGTFSYGEVEDYTVNIVAGGGGVSYCTSKSTDTSYEGISKVILNTINKSSSRSFYSDFTAVSTNLSAGAQYSISITPSKNTAADKEGYSVYIDYNNNGQFESTELAFGTTSTSSSAISGTITVPASATNGQKRMRVTMRYTSSNTVPDACISGAMEGEVEDYTVNITGGSAKPVAPVTSRSTATETKSNNVITIYPNPVQGKTLNVMGVQNGQRYMIENSLGKIILTGKFSSGSIDVSALPVGIYFIKIVSGHVTVNRKFVKE